MKIKKVKLMAILLSVAMVFSNGNVMTALATEDNNEVVVSDENINDVVEGEESTEVEEATEETTIEEEESEATETDEEELVDLVKEELTVAQLTTEFETKLVPEKAMNFNSDCLISTLGIEEFDYNSLIKYAAWAEPFDWSVDFELDTSKPVGIYVGLYKDYEAITYWGYTEAYSGRYNLSVEQFLKGDGEYFFVIVSVDENEEWNLEYVDRRIINYKVPAKKLDTVKRIDCTLSGILTWDEIENADSYIITIYRLNGGKYEEWARRTSDEPRLYYPYTNGDNFFVKIKACSENVSAYLPSESDYIKIIKVCSYSDTIIDTRWSDDIFGVPEFIVQNDDNVVLYLVSLFNVDNNSFGDTYVVNKDDTNLRVCRQIRDSFTESGNYKFFIQGLVDAGISEDGYTMVEPLIEYMSADTIHYTKPEKTLKTVQNVSWDKYYNLVWDKIDNADYYDVIIYKLTNDGEYHYIKDFDELTNNSVRLYDISDDGRYLAKISAHVNDIRRYNASYTDYIEITTRPFVNKENYLSNVKWSKENPGSIEYTVNGNKSLDICADIYIDGVKTNSIYGYWNSLGSGKQFSDCRSAFTKSGKYTYVVKVMSSDEVLAEYECTEPYVFSLPTKKLETVKSVQTSKNGVIRWNPIKNAAKYIVEAYEYKNNTYDLIYTFEPLNPYDDICYLNDDRQIYVVISAISSDITEYQSSKSEMIKLVPIDDSNGFVKQAHWNSKNPGTIECEFNKTDKDIEYGAFIYKKIGNNDISTNRIWLGVELYEKWNSDKTAASIAVNSYFDMDGEYSFAITGVVYNNEYNCYETVFTYCSDEVFSYKLPEKKLAPITNVKWNKDGIVSFDANDDAAYYEMNVYEMENGNRPNSWYGWEFSGNQIDLSRYINAYEETGIEIIAFPKDITKYQSVSTGLIILNSDNLEKQPSNGSSSNVSGGSSSAPSGSSSSAPASPVSSAPSSSSAAPAKPATFTYIFDGEVPLASEIDGGMIGGYKFIQVMAGQTKALKASQLNTYAGQKVLIGAMVDKEYSIMFDMSKCKNVEEDLRLAFNKVELPQVSDKFTTLSYVPVAKDQVLPVGTTIHFNVGKEFIGKKAYIFEISDGRDAYDLKNLSAVNEIGNIAYEATEMTNILIMIEK